MATSTCRVELNPLSGHAVITFQEEVFTFAPDEGVLPAQGTHLGMWLQGGPRLFWKTEDEFPFPNALWEISREINKEHALRSFIHVLDPDISLSLRGEFAEIVEEVLANDEVYAWVIETMLAVPLPEDADIENAPKDGLVGEIISQAVKKWRKPQ